MVVNFFPPSFKLVQIYLHTSELSVIVWAAEHVSDINIGNKFHNADMDYVNFYWDAKAFNLDWPC